MRNPALAAIKFYQLAISPYLPGLCRHIPSCSNYSYQAISKHGLLRGMWLTLKRLGRCNPLGSSGYDPVP